MLRTICHHTGVVSRQERGIGFVSYVYVALVTCVLFFAGCGIFEDINGLPDPCADEDQTCTPGSEGYTCGKRNSVLHELSTLFAAGFEGGSILPGSSMHQTGSRSPRERRNMVRAHAKPGTNIRRPRYWDSSQPSHLRDTHSGARCNDHISPHLTLTPVSMIRVLFRRAM